MTDAVLGQAPAAAVPRRLLIGWVAMVVGMFLAILDIQIVASSLSDIQAGLAASPDEISWIQTAYLIAEVIMIPLSGYLARMWGSRRLFVISAIGFTAASFACAFAWSLQSLIVLRVLQGFIGGGMIPCVFSSIYMIFPKERQASANVVVGMIVTCAPAIGPTLGGFITDTFSWHWLFLINVVPGLIIIMLVSAMPDFDQADPSLIRQIDLRGLVLMALFLGGLEFVLDEGPRDDWFDEPVITFWTCVCSLSGVLFLWRCLTYHQPLIDLRIFANRNFFLGCLVAAVMGMGLFGGVYVTPLYLARVQHFNALQIGTVMSIGGIAMFLTAPLAGRLAAAFGARVVLAGGILLAACGFFGASLLSSEAAGDQLFWPLAIRGMGLVSMIITLNTIALGTLQLQQMSNASGLYNLSRNMGGAMGLAAINTLLDRRFDLHLARLSDWINPVRPEFQEFARQAGLYLDSAGLGSDQRVLALAQQLVSREALMMTFNDIQLLMGAAIGVSLLLLPLMSPPRQAVSSAH
ncbi:DHA2 family efflux MFS transporter permease subunit [Pseudomaricurvus sp. HS19]|uniref:DHA2 family efflux MFS transporter permease subunit n=1 Tax=Pseudomaricurvus sp. HS19 TaxID=2692626 RepID=UPI0019262EA2